MHEVARTAYRRLIRTAYILAVDGLPLNTFRTLVNVQKANGVQLIEGTDNSNRAHVFTQFLADAVRQKICGTLIESSVFSTLSDGSQARKTRSEKRACVC